MRSRLRPKSPLMKLHFAQLTKRSRASRRASSFVSATLKKYIVHLLLPGGAELSHTSPSSNSEMQYSVKLPLAAGLVESSATFATAGTYWNMSRDLPRLLQVLYEGNISFQERDSELRFVRIEKLAITDTMIMPQSKLRDSTGYADCFKSTFQLRAAVYSVLAIAV